MNRNTDMCHVHNEEIQAVLCTQKQLYDELQTVRKIILKSVNQGKSHVLHHSFTCAHDSRLLESKNVKTSELRHRANPYQFQNTDI